VEQPSRLCTHCADASRCARATHGWLPTSSALGYSQVPLWADGLSSVPSSRNLGHPGPPKTNVAATAEGHECVSPFQGCACTGVSEGTRKHGRWPNFTQRFHPVHLHSNPHNLTRSSGAFDGNGFGRQQAQLSSLVVHHLQLSGAVGCTLLRPTMDQLRLCFPRRARVPAKSLFGPFDAPHVVVAAAAGAGAALRAVPLGGGRGVAAVVRPAHEGRGGGHVYGRTRSGVAFKSE
jgi:hypothetical protein